ncbi:MAG: hypothetical protein R3195_06950 [Gemmatimonadota bacterium]|nr:hypothetical protein [Gemmatimonadota bacterium]
MKRAVGSLRTLLAALAMSVALAGTVVAQSGPVGDWEGTLSAGGQEFPLVFHITGDAGGALSTTLDSPSQSAFGMVGDTTTFEDGALAITFSAIGGSYEATISEDGNTFTGTWTQAGMSFPLEIARSDG